ncbi:MAG: glycosyltransferase, partial [bacterium]|nr:glycosyltransferase [bacterium]
MALINALWFVSLGTESNATLSIILSYAFFMLIAVSSVYYAPKKFLGLPLFVLLVNSCSIRFVMTQFECSDDVYRYVWEGHIQNNGYNPYRMAPNSSELQYLIWEDYKVPNHSDLTTIYPPLSLYVFRILSFYSLDYGNYQYVFCILDILVIGLILYLLFIRGDPLQNVTYYCLNPVSIVAFSARGHLDVLMIFWLLLGLIFHHRKMWLAMWTCLALAVLSKLLVLLLIPCFINPKNWRYISIFFIVLLAAYTPFLLDGVPVFKTFYIFGTQFEYNNSLFGILNFLVQNNITSLVILFVVAGLICSWSIIVYEDVLLTGMIITACFLFCAPTVHYWYLSLMVPFLCFYRKSSLLAWCATSGTWFIVLNSMQEGRFDHYPYYQILQYGPVYLLLIKEFYELIFKVPNRTKSTNSEKLSILIPVLNEELNLRRLLPQLKSQMLDGDDIIIVDGGSDDLSLKVANDFKAQIVSSSRGRGYQICRGMEFVKNPIVLILHADQQLKV